MGRTAAGRWPVAGAEGVLWHAEWILGDWEVSPRALWRDVHELAGIHELVVHLLFDIATVTATFSAFDAPEDIADAIGALFDGVLREGVARHGSSMDEAIDIEAARLSEVSQLPARVQANSSLTLFDPLSRDNPPVFGA